MLVQLLVSLSDPNLRKRASRLRGKDLRPTIAEPVPDLSNILDLVAPDVLLVDRNGLGGDPEKRIGELQSGNCRPDILYVAIDEGPDQRARLLARQCLAIIDGSAREAEFRRAVLGVISKWRASAIGRLEAAKQRQALQVGEFITANEAMKKFLTTARRVSSADTSVLILGETGVGKERLASAIHSQGRRKDNPMVVVNCGAIPEPLLESELFGHERGAFTGAERTHRGYFELAHRGTILLDEIGEMPVHLQVKLLRVLEEREIRRLGAEAPIPVDVRVIASTNRDLEKETEAERFRSDLFYRLSVVSLTIPPLRERKEDISPLVLAYMKRFRRELGRDVRGVAPEAMQAMEAYHWPGNVREVVNVTERAVLLCDSDEITLHDLPEGVAVAHMPNEVTRLAGGQPASHLDHKWFQLPLRDARHAWNAALERLYLQRMLREMRGRVGQAAAQMGIDPRSLYAKMKMHGLEKESFRES